MLGKRDGFRNIHNERVAEERTPSNGSRGTRQRKGLLKQSLPKKVSVTRSALIWVCLPHARKAQYYIMSYFNFTALSKVLFFR